MRRKPAGRARPKRLTRPERRRFIRTYYYLWDMMRLNPEDWTERLKRMTLKQVYLLYEFCFLEQNVGGEEGCIPKGRITPPKRGKLSCVIQDYVREYQSARENKHD